MKTVLFCVLLVLASVPVSGAFARENAGVCYNGTAQAFFTGSISGGVLTVPSAPTYGRIAVGQWVWFPNPGNANAALTSVITATQITSLGTGSGGVGTYYVRDTADFVPAQQLETAGVTVPAPSSRNTIDLRTYGTANCYIIASGHNIIQTAANSNLVLVGNGNTIELNSHVGAFGGSAAHRAAVIIGNDNTGYMDAAGGVNTYVVGTANTMFGPGGVEAESRTGNIWVATGSNGVGGLGVWRFYPGERGASPFGFPPDTFNFVLALRAAGCSSPTNNPACATTAATYDEFRQIDNTEEPGVHTYCVVNHTCNNSNPFASWVDCTRHSNTMASFLSVPTVITGGAAPRPNTPPANSPDPPFPAGIPPNLGPANLAWFGPLFVNDHVARSRYTINFYYSAFGAGMPMLLEPWSYENNARLTITVRVSNGFMGGLPNYARCSEYPARQCYKVSGTYPALHEALAAMNYYTGGGGFTRDELSVTVTNTGGGSYSHSYPITIQQGSLCP